LDEQQAIHSLKQGDPGGLEYLVRAHQLRATRAAFLILGDRGLAEEVVQETFLRLLRSIRGFDASRPFEPWFLRSVINAALKVARSSKRHLPLEDADGGQALARLAARMESPEAHIEAAEAEEQLHEALDRLSPRQRLVLVQRYYLEMSEAEMAAASGTATGTIKWLLNAARRRLRGVLVERSER
jgi:RNA polymerase sigma-70 factor (ECF subfamily)